jgi:hypothetical protein
MPSRTEVANIITSKLGEDDQILDLDAEQSKIARSIRTVWDQVLEVLLRRHAFNFSVTRVPLTAEAGWAGIGEWTYRFPLPADFVRLLDLSAGQGLERDYQLEGQFILFREPGPLFLRYVRLVTSTGEWDALFVEAFATRLAWQICDRVTGDSQRKAQLWSEFRQAIGEATGVDGRENPPEPAEDTSWLTARVDGVTGPGEGSSW